jgi:ribosomal protein S18 acetylase RimI-like enzyme
MVRLRPMREDEFLAFLAASKAGYADDIERNGHWSHEDAQKKAEEDFAATLPRGLSTEGHYIRVVEDEDSDEAVGWLWFGERKRRDFDVAWIFDITIDEHARGRGFGRAAMLALEEEVRALGLTHIDLNVFGGNERARSLYRSLGYREDAVLMGKEL